MSQAATQPTFEELCELEPRLLGLLHVAQALYDQYKDAPRVCTNELWAGPKGLKSRLVKLVGWRAGKPELRTSRVYDLCYEAIYAALPACRGCICATPIQDEKESAHATA